MSARTRTASLGEDADLAWVIDGDPYALMKAAGCSYADVLEAQRVARGERVLRRLLNAWAAISQETVNP